MLFSRRRHQPLLRLTTRRNLNLSPGLNSWDHYNREFLRLDDYYVKVLTLKDPPSKTEPNILKHLLELPCEGFIVSEC